MQRKHFLQSIVPVAALASITNKSFATTISKRKINIPPYLQKGDTIGIVSPAGSATEKEIEGAIATIKEQGFEVLIGSSIGKNYFSFGGTDEERLADLQNMLNNTSVKAILCARGGYGCVRIVDAIDWYTFKQHPKWIIGFSDITVLHSHIHQQLQIASVHGKMASQFPETWNISDDEQKATLLSIFNCIAGQPHSYTSIPNTHNKLGNTTGVLVGGNLKTIESLSGSKSDIDTKGKILFVEDTGEALYSIDRMFFNLKRSGKLQHIKGLVVGGFKLKDENPNNPFGETIYEIVAKHTQQFNYPVAFDFPVGHQKNNYALICGGVYNLMVTNSGSTLQYIL